jgi:hypothetical protein
MRSEGSGRNIRQTVVNCQIVAAPFEQQIGIDAMLTRDERGRRLWCERRSTNCRLNFTEKLGRLIRLACAAVSMMVSTIYWTDP